MSKIEFKVGDTVQRINSTNGETFPDKNTSRFEMGQTGVITELKTNELCGKQLFATVIKPDGTTNAGNDLRNLNLIKAVLPKENNVSKVSFLKTNGSVTLHYNGQTKVVAKDDDRFEKIIQAIKDDNLDAIPGIVDIEASLRKQGLDVRDGLVHVKGEAMPSELNSRIMEYKAEGIPYASLLKFWENLRQNPSFNSRKQLFKFLENKGHSITEDGCFIGYRGITNDFKDRHTGKYDNRPGSICEMPRELVNDNPDETCSHGLHVGGYEYAKDFGPKLVIVKVNPKDVVAVPNDYNGQKMRVCKFEVLSEATGILTKPVVNEKGGESTWTPQDQEEYEGNNFDQDEPVPTPVKPRRVPNYANNHNKRGKDGRFAPAKRSRR